MVPHPRPSRPFGNKSEGQEKASLFTSSFQSNVFDIYDLCIGDKIRLEYFLASTIWSNVTEDRDFGKQMT